MGLLPVICWACLGLALLQFIYLFYFFQILVQKKNFGLFFCLKVEQINFYFILFKGVPNIVIEGVPNTNQI